MLRRRRNARSAAGRVLILLENLPFDRDARVRRQCATLVGAGYEVTVICPRRSWGGRVPDAGPVHLLTYPRPQDASSALGYVAEYAYSLAMTGILVMWAAVTRGFDVIQACSPPDLLWLVAAPFRLLGKRYVFDHHDLSPELFLSHFERRGIVYRSLLVAERRAVDLADAVITTNTTMQSVVAERSGVSQAAFTVVRNGPHLHETESGSPRPELKLGRRWLCCWHGVMGRQDGVDIVVETAAQLVHGVGRRDCTFALVGDGEVRAEIEALARELDVSAWLQFPGWLDRAELAEYLATADVGLSPDPPGRHMDWSTPIKAIEYMAHGVPVVGFQRAEQVAAVGGGGVFVAGDSTADLAAAIDELLDDAELRARLGACGRERIEKGLAWDHQAKPYLEVYAHLLGAGGDDGP